MFFHYYTRNYHLNTIDTKFLYYKITLGWYFHYNIYGKDYYLENMGYLWIINDYTLAIPFEKSSKNINNDFSLLIFFENLSNYYSKMTPYKYVSYYNLAIKIHNLFLYDYHFIALLRLHQWLRNWSFTINFIIQIYKSDEMKKTIEPFTDKQKFESSVVTLFTTYLNNRADSFEQQISKTED